MPSLPVLKEICLFLRDDEVHEGSITSMDGDGLFPCSRFAENGPLNCFLAKYIQCILSTVPCFDSSKRLGKVPSARCEKIS